MNEIAARILTDHREMDELLLLHQEALVEQDLREALARFEVFRDRLRAHIELESRELLPRHAQLPQPRWRTQVYALEHDKVLELAEKIHERLRDPDLTSGLALDREQKLPADPTPAPGRTPVLSRAPEQAPEQARRRWIIRLLDDERTLKNVLEHHEEREEKGMLPELELAGAGPDSRV